jgi:hypothetical protein
MAFRVSTTTAYELVVAVPGQPITHRSPVPRGSDVIQLRPAILAKDDVTAAAIVVMTRPRGYFGHGRVVFTLDGPAVPGGVRERVPGVSLARLRLPDAAARSVAARFYGETIVTRTWPRADGHVAETDVLTPRRPCRSLCAPGVAPPRPGGRHGIARGEPRQAEASLCPME